ncbi:hypothetical protein [Rhizobium acaciae]|uniref:hypothetical protein n=1 Tax=Rhizobium acaciae TaxID=2989736 RepID=UPI00221FAEAE|nr:hypothetical protein [Rhizobium acaciae]MCW1752390.1 hypothetical protein [Rhizobium acaciae]
MSSIESKEFVLAGVVMKRLLSGPQTNGQFGLFENISAGNTKTPIHAEQQIVVLVDICRPVVVAV